MTRGAFSGHVGLQGWWVRCPINLRPANRRGVLDEHTIFPSEPTSLLKRQVFLFASGHIAHRKKTYFLFWKCFLILNPNSKSLTFELKIKFFILLNSNLQWCKRERGRMEAEDKNSFVKKNNDKLTILTNFAQRYNLFLKSTIKCAFDIMLKNPFTAPKL